MDRDYSLVYHRDAPTLVRPFPISVDFDGIEAEARSAEVADEMDRIASEWDLEDKIVGLGIDRIDYTKGIPHRIRAIGRFLEKNPEYIGKMVFVQAGVMSRTNISAYQQLGEQIDACWRKSTAGSPPATGSPFSTCRPICPRSR